MFDNKSFFVLKFKFSWSVFSLHEEDIDLRDEIWTENYGNARLIMRDDVNVNFIYKPLLAHMQRLKNSSCYG